jgi:thiol-disulfide isomerase/thioredoxin
MKNFFLVLCVLGGLSYAFHHSSSGKISGKADVLPVLRLGRSGEGVKGDFAPRQAPYLALYHGASWCGPCQAFSPRLVEFYRGAAAQVPAHFQLVMVNYDQSDADMLGYMRQHKMPFPGLRQDAAGDWGQATGDGIPNLIILETATGKVISSSYSGSNYQGCDVPLQVLSRIASQGHP